jgi:arginine deiminase
VAKCCIKWEAGKLKKVILHQPGLGLERLTAENHDRLLFDSVIDVEKARKEHEHFQKILTQNDVEVFLLQDLLTQTLASIDAKKWLIERRIKLEGYGLYLGESLAEYFYEFSAEELSECLIGGITKRELKKQFKGLIFSSMDNDEFILPPLPNHFFMRDSSSWIGEGVSINPMAKWIRLAETINLKAIYYFHPMFSKETFNIWYGENEKINNKASIEGGDILVIGKGVLLVGMSERTTPRAIEILAHSLFVSGAFKEVIVVKLPICKDYMHLDTVMTMLDYDAFIVYKEVIENAPVWTIKYDDGYGQIIEQQDDIFKTIANALEIDSLRILTTGGKTSAETKNEQKHNGNNLLAIAPGVFIGYEHNILTNNKLREAGFEVIETPGLELDKGRGGARCMSCPLLRE